jgi:hypothetical protein
MKPIEDQVRLMSQTSLSLIVESKPFEKFLQLLQEGVRVSARVGSTVRAFLCDDLGLSAEYVDKRIQTLFLNGKAIDNPDTALLREDSTLALSAAMPGLLGATLRKGGYYARMRNEISYQEQGTGVSIHEGFVLLKLFNLLPAEIGPTVLKRGIWLKGEKLNQLFKELSEEMATGYIDAKVDGQTLNLRDFAGKSLRYELVLVKVERASSTTGNRRKHA